MAGSDRRVRAKSCTEAARRLPHPRLVQTWLLALRRWQWGQMVFRTGIIFPQFMYRHDATDFAGREWPVSHARTSSKVHFVLAGNRTIVLPGSWRVPRGMTKSGATYSFDYSGGESVTFLLTK